MSALATASPILDGEHLAQAQTEPDQYCVTLICDPKHSLGKVFHADGSKTAAVSVTCGSAEMVRCVTHDDMVKLYERVSEDPHAALMLDYFPGIPVGVPFELHSEASMRRALKRGGSRRDDVTGIQLIQRIDGTVKAVTRLGENIAPSVWALIDRDIDEHTPSAFAELNDDQYFAALSKALPGIDRVTRVRTLSSSARAMRDGKPLGHSAGHTLIQLTDPSAKAHLRIAFRTQAIVAGIAWTVPRYSRTESGKVVGKGWKCLADDSTFGVGRLLFCGKPVSKSPNVIEIRRQQCRIEHGAEPTFDGNAVRVPADVDLKAASSAHGCVVTLSRSSGGVVSIKERSLTLDTQIETERIGGMTVRAALELLQAPDAPNKLRCQAPFRASESFAAYFWVETGEPVIHDSGTATTYLLTGSDQCKLEFGRFSDDDLAEAAGHASAEASEAGRERPDVVDIGATLPQQALSTTAAAIPANQITVAAANDPAGSNRTPARGRIREVGAQGDGRAVQLPGLLAALRRPAVCGWHIGWDSFNATVMVSNAGVSPSEWRKLIDTDNTRVREHLQREHDLRNITKEMMRDTINLVAEENCFDSAQTWLERQVWDGIPRIEMSLQRYFGAQDTPYTRAVSRYIWTALAGRVMQPGIKADMVPVAVGVQGTRKSTTIAAIAPNPDLFTEICLDTHDADTIRRLRGKVIGELAELSGMSKRDAESLKAFLSATSDQLIEKYKEHAITLPRRALFFGSSNRDDFLKDETGHRRWLPFDAGQCDPEALARDRDQLWAEGRSLFEARGIDYADAERLARAEHESFTEVDDWGPVVAKWLDKPVGAPIAPEFPDEPEGDSNFPVAPGALRRVVTARDVISGALGFSTERIGKREEMRMAKVLKGLGWASERRSIGTARARVFVRP